VGSEHPFLILCGGDTAEADDHESARVAARTLSRETFTTAYIYDMRLNPVVPVGRVHPDD
jgi:hypothetical protein